MYMNKNFLSTFKRVLSVAVVLLAAFLLIGCPEDTPPAASTPPADPANFTVVFGDMQAELTWEAVANAVEYRIYRADTADGTLTRIAEDVTITDTSYVDTGLTNGTTYRYVIRAVSSAGTESGDSAEASTTPTPPPDAPTGLSATASNFQVILSWDTVTDVTEYSVYRAESENGTFSRIAGDITNATTYTDADTSFAIDTAYYYVVRAVIRVSGSIGESTNSDVADATPLPLPATPANLAATASNSQVVLSWDAAAGATEYRVYRADTPDGTLTRIAEGTAITETTYTDADTGFTGGTTYRYTVRAVVRAGDDSTEESGDSNEVSALPLPLPAAPTNLTATPGNAQVTLSWDAVTGATEYRIYRAATANGDLIRVVTDPAVITAETYIETGLTNGTTYRYVVRTVSSNEESANSDEASTTPIPPPTPPTGFTAASSDTRVNLSWTAVTGATSYRIYRSATATGDLTRVADNITGTTHIDGDLTNGTAYRYAVRGVNSAGESGNSTVESVTPEDDHGNSRSAATALTSGTEMTGVLACQLNPHDEDYFSLPVTIAASGTPVQLTISSTANASASIILQDSNGMRIQSSSLRTGSPPQTITTTGTYYFRIACTDVELSMYRLTVTATEVSDSHGNTRAGATAVTSGTAVAGNLYVNDIDYFSIAVTGASTMSPVTITATTTGGVNTIGRIFNSTGTKLAENNDIGGNPYEDNFRVTHNATANGTYFIEVTGNMLDGFTTHIGEYSLTVTTSQ